VGIAHSQSGNTSYQRTLNGLICLIGLSHLCSSEKKKKENNFNNTLANAQGTVD